MYCPVCEREIKPCNQDEVESGEHESFIYIHDEIPHEDTDIKALSNPIQ